MKYISATKNSTQNKLKKTVSLCFVNIYLSNNIILDVENKNLNEIKQTDFKLYVKVSSMSQVLNNSV